MASGTKERILEAALEMFSQNGYAGTNIRELSASLGLVKSGVYKHYESKEAIWNALLDEMIAYYGEHFGSPEHLPPVPDSLEALIGLTEIFMHIFAGMMDRGLIRRDDPAMLAFAYTTPISALIHLCDREPEKTEEAITRAEAFCRHFVRTYGI